MGPVRRIASAASSLTEASFLSNVLVRENSETKAILKKANSAVMFLKLTQLAKTHMMRSHGSSAVCRMAIGAEGRKFDRCYARMRDTIKERICFRPLQRRHTVCLGESEINRRPHMASFHN